MLTQVIQFPKILEKIRQAKQLQVEVNRTESAITEAKNSLTALNYKTVNLIKLICQIKTSQTQLQNTFFKNTSGLLSVSPTQINEAADVTIREILAPVIAMDITLAGNDLQKKNSIVAIGKELESFGMKKAEFQNILKKISETTVELRYYVYSEDGYLLRFGDVEKPYEEDSDTSKVIVEFKVFDVSDNILTDSSLKSDIMDQIEPTIRKFYNSGNYDTNISSIEDGNRKVAKFVHLGLRQINNQWKCFGGSHLKFSSTNRLVNIEEAFFIDFDVKLRDTSYGIENVQRIGDGYRPDEVSYSSHDYNIPVMNVESLFFMHFNSALNAGSSTRKISLHAGTGWNRLTVNGIQRDKWYNIRYDFWYDSDASAYRRMMVVTDLETKQKNIAVNEYSMRVNDIASKWFWIGDSSPDNYGNISYGDEVLIDNFQMRSVPDFVDPPLTKFFDNQNIPQKTSLSNGYKNFKMTANSFSWASAVSKESFYTGRRYFEITNVVDNPNGLIVGLIPADMNHTVADFYPGKYTSSFGVYANRSQGVQCFMSRWDDYHDTQGAAYVLETTNSHPDFLPLSQGGVVRVAVDFDLGNLFIAINDKWLGSNDTINGSDYDGVNVEYHSSYAFSTFRRWSPMKLCVAIKGSTQEVKLNVGQEPFTYAPPSQFIAWGKQGVI